MQPIHWLGDSLERLREFEPDAKRIAGHQLERVQAGRQPSDFKPMPSIGLGVNEIRIRTRESYRLLYVAKYAEAVTCYTPFRRRAGRRPGKTWRSDDNDSGYWPRKGDIGHER